MTVVGKLENTGICSILNAFEASVTCLDMAPYNSEEIRGSLVIF